MIVIIDNYDSFTYNLAQYFQTMEEDVRVFRNDEVTAEEVQQMDPTLIVLAPGPGNPGETGVAKEVLTLCSRTIPILGICLGHQLIVEHFGGVIEKGEQPVHGKVTEMTHDGRTIFRDLPERIKVTRYHSLKASTSRLPQVFEISAVSEDEVVMAVRHCELPVEGIQFHPESILTEFGMEMLERAYRQAVVFKRATLEVAGI
ncbi:aminodeoxychorismate/anthranilate synthase component II [Halobacillus sp. ACCC02827]|uniref:anthranilate synthase component II n=1 Tax=Halobacillus sp. ACCC02827 TaxID=3052090 RepID=UPI00256FBDC5|nr:aminodeoxychorismate/anthranilate synthase component II [Halobacillus sp. ACCC02827]WJE15567.1 aminodeoxychorismate/anthranilate synthase component II [Halobacillus sp. ACCC02827]